MGRGAYDVSADRTGVFFTHEANKKVEARLKQLQDKEDKEKALKERKREQGRARTERARIKRQQDALLEKAAERKVEAKQELKVKQEESSDDMDVDGEYESDETITPEMYAKLGWNMNGQGQGNGSRGFGGHK
ncbi:hypothetical protein K491DRAFT_713277 [Lophiostoma macrostomum CBS 122681]|uniref:Uncharacterized protein n=1 Tax=Lophiostoma macrostomum CBS 122681 TaxID=1314788 RepID=A0A6A6THH7_9PLEO|nr:hypothetical protein K491DRAFT_713277 [Lophiostoma macrostomum CBS 122681]